MDTTIDLQSTYARRFGGLEAYRMRVWSVLCADFYQRYVPTDGAVLDLGCGFGEFILQIRAAQRFGMDLNPASAEALDGSGVTLIQQDCSEPWPLEDGVLDAVFTSNFFEHLPDKDALARTMDEAHRCLKPGGALIAMGPNIAAVPGRYWDFWDHYLPLTDLSLAEGLELHGFDIERRVPRFLPYTMVGERQYPMSFIRAYLRLPLAWRFMGHQFLVVARRES